MVQEDLELSKHSDIFLLEITGILSKMVLYFFFFVPQRDYEIEATAA